MAADGVGWRASLLDGRSRRSIEIGAPNLRLAGQEGHVLSQCPLLHMRLEPLRDAIPPDLECQELAVNAAIDRNDVEAVTRLHQLAQDSRGPQSKQGALEFRYRVAAPNLAEVAVLLPGGAIGQLACQRGEALRRRQQLRQRLLGEGADFGNADTRRHLEQNVACMDEVAAVKIIPVRLVMAPAFSFRRRRDADFPGKKALDDAVDLLAVGHLRRQHAKRLRALT